MELAKPKDLLCRRHFRLRGKQILTIPSRYCEAVESADRGISEDARIYKASQQR